MPNAQHNAGGGRWAKCPMSRGTKRQRQYPSSYILPILLMHHKAEEISSKLQLLQHPARQGSSLQDWDRQCQYQASTTYRGTQGMAYGIGDGSPSHPTEQAQQEPPPTSLQRLKCCNEAELNGEDCRGCWSGKKGRAP